MADNQAGIELILSAPDVKPIMDAVIDDWKEINRQEKLAAEQLERYNEEAQKQLAHQKEIALGNQKIKDIVKDLDRLEKERADSTTFQAEHGKKNIIATIKGYFQQRTELKNLGKEIDGVNNQLRTLSLRQEAISLSARRGNSAAIKEYNSNEKAIKSLSNSLGGLSEKYNDVGSKLALTKQKFSGITQVLTVARTAAVAAAAGIALVVVAVGAAIIALGKQNTVANEQFKRAGENFSKAKTALSNALAPIALTIGKIFDGLAIKLAKFLNENAQEIHDWAIEAAKNIAGFAAYVGAAFDKIVNFGEQVIGTIKLVAAAADVLRQGTFLQFGKAGNAVDEFAKQFNEIKKLEADGKNLAAPGVAAKKAYDAAGESLKSFTLDFLTTSNLTKEKIEELDALFKGLEGANDRYLEKRKKAIEDHKRRLEELRAEYKRLTADINKQIQDLDIKEAGAFAGVLLKAELAASAIREAGKLAVHDAGLLQKSQEEIDDIIRKTARLSESIRKDAVVFLNSQANTLLEEIVRNLRDAQARNTNSEDELKFSRELDDQLKKLKLAESILQPIIQSAKKEIEKAKEERRGINKDIITDGEDALTKLSGTAQSLSQLTSITALDFFRGKAQEYYAELKELTEKTIADLKTKGEQLDVELGSGFLTNDQKKEIGISVKVNDIDLAVAIEKLKQIDESLRLFKETGIAGVVETEATIRVRVEQGLGGIQGIQPKGPSKDGEGEGKGKGKGKGLPAGEIAEGLNFAVELYSIAYNAIDEIVLNSIDAQIEALDRLVEARTLSVERLEADVEREAEFKCNGLANDYDILKKKLTDETKLRDEAQKQALALAAQRVKTQKALDTASPISSIVTAIANVFAATTLGNPFGVILAIAQTAALLTAFAASKIEAAKLARAYKGSSRVGETFGVIAPGEGYDDSPGKDRGLSVVDSKGRLRGFMGGDEYLNKQSVSKKHRKALDYLNNNERRFDDVDLYEALRVMDSIKIKPAFDIPDMSLTPRVDYARITAKNQKLRERMIVVNTKGVTKEELKEAVKEGIKEQTQSILDYLESRPSIVPNDWLKDYTSMTSKSNKRFKKG